VETEQLVREARDTLTVRRVFGEPEQHGDITIIPAANVRGGAGGGGGEGPEGQGQGSGMGFGMSAKPAGAFVVRDGDARWVPAVDRNMAIIAMALVGLAVLRTIRAVVRARS
jgi:uncharacterized spore protein YtfJ